MFKTLELQSYIKVFSHLNGFSVHAAIPTPRFPAPPLELLPPRKPNSHQPPNMCPNSNSEKGLMQQRFSILWNPIVLTTKDQGQTWKIQKK